MNNARLILPIAKSISPSGSVPAITKIASVKLPPPPPILKREISTTSLKAASFNVQDEEDFKKRVLENNKIVIVDFHATWCGPCKILGPRLEKTLATFEDKADFAKVDVDQLADLALDYKINSVPTVIAIKNGKEVGKVVGLLDDDRIKKFVKDAIDK